MCLHCNYLQCSLWDWSVFIPVSFFIVNPGVVCETLQVSGQTIANGNYNLTSTQTWFDPKIPEEAITNSTKSIKVPIYKHTKQDLHIFYKPDGDGWRMGRKALIKNGSFIYKSKLKHHVLNYFINVFLKSIPRRF